MCVYGFINLNTSLFSDSVASFFEMHSWLSTWNIGLPAVSVFTVDLSFLLMWPLKGSNDGSPNWVSAYKGELYCIPPLARPGPAQPHLCCCCHREIEAEDCHSLPFCLSASQVDLFNILPIILTMFTWNNLSVSARTYTHIHMHAHQERILAVSHIYNTCHLKV